MDEPRITTGDIVGQIDASVVPRFVGPATFARIPQGDQVTADVDVAVVGVPFDAGTSFRPGARFGPAHIRESSRLLRPYNPAQDISPFAAQQVIDAGDIVANPFDIGAALGQIEAGARDLLERAKRLVVLGGDHTIALPLLRAMHAVHGPVAVVHFDAHLDTWDTYFGAPYTHGTPFRRAMEENLIDLAAAMHVGIRGPLYDGLDLTSDRELGFALLTSDEVDDLGPRGTAERIVDRVDDHPMYVSIDVDVMDPAFTPGTGTPEAGGLSSREMLRILRGLAGRNLVGVDVVEVAPAYDHANITGVAASHIAYDALSLMARRRDA
jgi:agmatinase